MQILQDFEYISVDFMSLINMYKIELSVNICFELTKYLRIELNKIGNRCIKNVYT